MTRRIIVKLISSGLITVLLLMLSDQPVAADNYTDSELSQGQKNIVLRARQVLEIEWTPLKEVEAWHRHPNFMEGETYTGIPYGMPANPKHYVPYGTPFEAFLEAVADPESLMYTAVATRTTEAPFYSLDCSAFLSWVWDLEKIYKTVDMHLVAHNIGKDISDLEVGDALNKSADHVVLVSHIERGSEGEITGVGIMELIDPIAKFTWYGGDEEGQFSVDDINKEFFDKGYVILRYKERDSVKYMHDCNIPLDNDFCTLCFDSGRVWNPVMMKALESAEARIRSSLMLPRS